EKQQALLEEVIKQAREALERGDEPYGAVVATPEGEIIAADGNRENSMCDPTRHAEINTIGKACKILGTKSLAGYVLVGNYYPCPMCSSAILMTGIRTLYCGSFFKGFDVLFEECAQNVRDAGVENRQDGMDDARCRKQVYDGRAYLQAQPGYFSGHLSGVLQRKKT
ncbi:MAG: nucleoside deaminase, partial [Christensenellaceae bacterium]|nr:nucleoside deaminase [Christensenellaceae bacterium]